MRTLLSAILLLTSALVAPEANAQFTAPLFSGSAASCQPTSNLVPTNVELFVNTEWRGRFSSVSAAIYCPIASHPSLTDVNDIAKIEARVLDADPNYAVRVRLCFVEPTGTWVCGSEGSASNNNTTTWQTVIAPKPTQSVSSLAHAVLVVRFPYYNVNRFSGYVVYD